MCWHEWSVYFFLYLFRNSAAIALEIIIEDAG